MKPEANSEGADGSGPRPAPFRMEKRLAGLEETPASAKAEVRNLSTQGDQFLARYPTWKSLDDAVENKRSAEAAARVPKSAGPKALPFRPRAWLALAAGFLLCLVSARLVFGPGKQRESDLAVKGEPFFTMLINGRPGTADRDNPAAPGDTVQIFLHHDNPLHYALFYRDDGGPWELYFASEGAPQGSLRGEPLRHAIVLDTGWRVQEMAALAGAQPPGGVGRDCLPGSPSERPARKAEAPRHCREISLNLFRFKRAVP